MGHGVDKLRRSDREPHYSHSAAPTELNAPSALYQGLTPLAKIFRRYAAED